MTLRHRSALTALYYLFLPALLHAGSILFLYTIDFDATAKSAPTSVSYLSDGLLGPTNSNFIPQQSTVISLPGAGATQYPGAGAGTVSNSYFSLAFDENNALSWLYQANTSSAIVGAGSYAFSSSTLSTALDPGTVYTPAGKVVVQQLAVAPTTFRYTEAWNATANSAATSFYYDSPVFLVGFTALTGSDVKIISLPSASSTPYVPLLLFGTGDNLAEGYFVDNSSNSWFYTAQLSPAFDAFGTRAFSTSSLNFNGRTTPVAGSLTVAQIASTPEPGTLWSGAAGLLLLAAFITRGGRRRLFPPRQSRHHSNLE